MNDEAQMPGFRCLKSIEAEDAVLAVLKEFLDLAKPDDLEFLETHARYIARCIVSRLYSQDNCPA